MHMNGVTVHRLGEKASKMAEKHPKCTVLGRLKSEMIASSDVLAGKHETLRCKLNNKFHNVSPISSCSKRPQHQRHENFGHVKMLTLQPRHGRGYAAARGRFWPNRRTRTSTKTPSRHYALVRVLGTSHSQVAYVTIAAMVVVFRSQNQYRGSPTKTKRPKIRQISDISIVYTIHEKRLHYAIVSVAT